MFTVDEFYEQRVRDGVFPDPAAASHAHGGGESHTYKVELSYEEEQKQEDLKEEEELMKQRRFDDFKDGLFGCINECKDDLCECIDGSKIGLSYQRLSEMKCCYRNGRSY